MKKQVGALIPKRTVRVSSDIGGTFTDAFFIDEKSGKYWYSKTHTTPHDLSEGIITGITQSGNSKEISSFVHGSTIVINTLTERKGGKVGLITTKGFRDVLEITRCNRPDLYNLQYTKPECFVPRHLRLEVEERLDYKGNVLKKLNEEDVEKAVKQLVKSKVEAIAVCFLHSYTNTEHEKRCGRIIEKFAPNIPYTLSHQICSEWREYERTSTTVLNSYCLPTSVKYISTLAKKLKDIGVDENMVNIMQSNGGTFSLEQAKIKPIQCCESGPVAGVIGCSVIGKLIGEDKIISLDFGGTTTKSCLIEKCQPKITTSYFLGHGNEKVAKYPIKVPTIDIVEIGSGGGSIAHLDEVGALKVGPRSQGAKPGPACYGNKLGNKATVTDADVFQGYINPDYFCGGTVKIDKEKSAEVLKDLRNQYNKDLSLDQMANGISRIADNQMVTTIKLVSVRKGYDASEFTVIAYGGNGSLHGPSIFEYLDVKKIIVPRYPGVFASFGMLLSSTRRDFVRTKVMKFSSVSPEKLTTMYSDLEEEAKKSIEKEEKLDLKKETLLFQRFGDMRYCGQDHAVKVPFPNGKYDKKEHASIQKRFHDLHEKSYGFKLSSEAEIVNLHLLALISKEKKIEKLDNKGKSFKIKGEREVFFKGHGRVKTKTYEREELPPDNKWHLGPGVIEEYTATTLVHPNQKFKIDEYGLIHIEKNEKFVKKKVVESKEIDSFTLEIIKDSLLAVSDEMFITTQRTSMSTIIYEVLDFATGICDPKGRLISQGNGVAMFIGLINFNVLGVLEKFKGKLDEGDVILLNDPYKWGGTHLSDVSVVKPIFFEKQLVGFAGNKAHWTEVGGSVAGSWSTDAKEIFQEGLRFTGLKIFRKGKISEDLVEVIQANVRTPKETIGDLMSQIGSLNVAETRIKGLCKKYGVKLYLASIEKILGEGRKSAKLAIKALPKVTVEAEDMIDDDGVGNGPFKVKAKVTIKEEEIVMDFTGTSGQVPGPINCGLTASITGLRTIFKAITNPTLANTNQGSFEALKIIIPEKTILSCEKPASVSTYWETMIFAADVPWKALASIVPKRLTAGHFVSVCGLSAWGFHPDTKELFILVEPQAGGWGAGESKDGENGLVCLGDGETFIIPIEVTECKYGIRVNKYEIHVPDDNSGAGKFRGGRGLLREYEITCKEIWITATFGRNKYKPWGFGGGKEGSNNFCKVIYKDTKKKHEEFGKCAAKRLEKGDIIQLYTATGGGWGNPFERNVKSVQSDVLNEYISLKSAKKDFGVIIDPKSLEVLGETEERKKTGSKIKKEG